MKVKRRVIAAIQERHKAGDSIADLADDFLLSRSTVRRYLALPPVTDAPCIEITEEELAALDPQE
jgi:response regulator of citrate/malate metabolism